MIQDWGGLPVVMMYIFLCTFFQGTDATVVDGNKVVSHGQTLQLLDQIGPVGRFGENLLQTGFF